MAAPAKRNGAPSAISRRAGPAAGEAAKGRDLCDMDHTNDEVKVRQDLRRTWSGRQGGDHEKGQRKVEARSHEGSVGSEMETVLEWSSVTADRALPGLKEEGYAEEGSAGWVKDATQSWDDVMTSGASAGVGLESASSIRAPWSRNTHTVGRGSTHTEREHLRNETGMERVGEKRGRTGLPEESTPQVQGEMPVRRWRPALRQAAEGMGSSKGGQEAAGGTGVAEEEGPSGNSKAQAKQRYKEEVGEKRGRTGLAEMQIPPKRCQLQILEPGTTAGSGLVQQAVAEASDPTPQGRWPKRTRQVCETDQCEQRRGSELCPSQCACGNHLPTMRDLKVKLGTALGQQDQQGLQVVKAIAAGEVITIFGSTRAVQKQHGQAQLEELCKQRGPGGHGQQLTYTLQKNVEKDVIWFVPRQDHDRLREEGHKDLWRKIAKAPLSPPGIGEYANHTCCPVHRNAVLMPLYYVDDKNNTIPVVSVIATRAIQVHEEIWVTYVTDSTALPFRCKCCRCAGACKREHSEHQPDGSSWLERQRRRRTQRQQQQQTPIPREVENRLRLTDIWQTVQGWDRKTLLDSTAPWAKTDRQLRIPVEVSEQHGGPRIDASGEARPISITERDLSRLQDGKYIGMEFLDTMLYMQMLTAVHQGHCNASEIRLWDSLREGAPPAATALSSAAGIVEWLSAWRITKQKRGHLFRTSFRHGHFFLYWVLFQRVEEGQFTVTVYAFDGLNMTAKPEADQMRGPLWEKLATDWNECAPDQQLQLRVSYKEVTLPHQGSTNNCAFVVVEVLKDILEKRGDPTAIFYSVKGQLRMRATRQAEGLGHDKYQEMRRRALAWVRAWCSGGGVTDRAATGSGRRAEGATRSTALSHRLTDGGQTVDALTVEVSNGKDEVPVIVQEEARENIHAKRTSAASLPLWPTNDGSAGSASTAGVDNGEDKGVASDRNGARAHCRISEAHSVTQLNRPAEGSPAGGVRAVRLAASGQSGFAGKEDAVNGEFEVDAPPRCQTREASEQAGGPTWVRLRGGSGHEQPGPAVEGKEVRAERQQDQDGHGRGSAQSDTRTIVSVGGASSATRLHRQTSGELAVDAPKVGESNGADETVIDAQDDVRVATHISKVADEVVDAMAEDPIMVNSTASRGETAARAVTKQWSRGNPALVRKGTGKGKSRPGKKANGRVSTDTPSVLKWLTPVPKSIEASTGAKFQVFPDPSSVPLADRPSPPAEHQDPEGTGKMTGHPSGKGDAEPEEKGTRPSPLGEMDLEQEGTDTPVRECRLGQKCAAALAAQQRALSEAQASRSEAGAQNRETAPTGQCKPQGQQLLPKLQDGPHLKHLKDQVEQAVEALRAASQRVDNDPAGGGEHPG